MTTTAKLVIDFYQQESEDWTVREVCQNTDGQSIFLITVYDGGIRINKAFDPGNLDNTSEVIVGYDVGRLTDYISSLYDDGSRIARNYDQDDEFAWSEEVFVCDTVGVLTDNY